MAIKCLATCGMFAAYFAMRGEEGKALGFVVMGLALGLVGYILERNNHV